MDSSGAEEILRLSFPLPLCPDGAKAGGLPQYLPLGWVDKGGGLPENLRVTPGTTQGPRNRRSGVRTNTKSLTACWSDAAGSKFCLEIPGDWKLHQISDYMMVRRCKYEKTGPQSPDSLIVWESSPNPKIVIADVSEDPITDCLIVRRLVLEETPTPTSWIHVDPFKLRDLNLTGERASKFPTA